MKPGLEKLGKEILVFDGAMGTFLMRLKGELVEPLELLNVVEPDLIARAHESYIDAGADIITTNTFGANRILLFRHGMGYRVEDLNRAAVKSARKASRGRALIAASIGPTGKLMEPFGDVRFEEIFDVFHEQASHIAAEGVDLFAIETMSDLGELRAALMACREASPGTPIIANLTFSENGRTIWGTDPLTLVSSIEPFDPIALGINCSLGPKLMLPIAEILCRESSIPVSVKPNAGMPRIARGGRTVFPMGASRMGEYASGFANAGCSIIGSCCGSTPEHTRAIAGAVKGRGVVKRRTVEKTGPVCRLTSAGQTVRIGHGYPLIAIGERINPTGRKLLSEELESGIFTRLAREARTQTQAGARMLDVNVGIPGGDEAWLMRNAIREAQKVTALPLSIDSISVNVIEAGLKAAVGRPLINSTTGGPSKLNVLLPMAKRFGAALIALCLDAKGIPETPEGRVRVAQRILAAAEKAGLTKDDLIFDPLTLTIGSDANAGAVTLETLRLLKTELGVNTSIGLSNISHGMPQREMINSSFLSMAAEAGLDAVIVNPLSRVVMGFIYAANVLTGKAPKDARILKMLTANGQSLGLVDETAKKSAKTPAKKSAEPKPVKNDIQRLIKCIMEGDGNAGSSIVRKLIQSGEDPDRLLDAALIPAMERVSHMFSASDFFLPEALLASEAFKACLDEIKRHQKRKARTVKGKVVLATVHGDIHDIGKNLVRMVLGNAGYLIHDLGVNVLAEDIVEAARQDQADIVALSSLMTTTMTEMNKIVDMLANAQIDSAVIVGGAVLTSKYAERIGAAAYGADAMEGLRKADNIMRSRRRRTPGNIES